jgi:hypothetical protein
MRVTIATSAPRQCRDGDIDWEVRVFCPNCSGMVGLVLNCQIDWSEAAEWLQQLETAQKQQKPQQSVTPRPSFQPSRQNASAPPITEADVEEVRRQLNDINGHADLLRWIGVDERDIRRRKKRRPH